MAPIWLADWPTTMAIGILCGWGGWFARGCKLGRDLEPFLGAARSAGFEAIATVEDMHARHEHSALASQSRSLELDGHHQL